MPETARCFDLSIPAPQRLAMLREAFASHAKRYPHCLEYAKPKTWRDIRGTTHKGLRAYIGGLSQGKNGETPVWYCHTGEQFRDERFADECDGGPNHRGWFTDGEDCSETARGIVARLPHGRFIAGYHFSASGERVYFPEVHENERDAAMMGDEHARVIGEQESEYRNRERAARNLAGDIESALQRLRECVVLRHQACMDYVRDEVRELIESIRDKRETLARDYADVEI